MKNYLKPAIILKKLDNTLENTQKAQKVASEIEEIVLPLVENVMYETKFSMARLHELMEGNRLLEKKGADTRNNTSAQNRVKKASDHHKKVQSIAARLKKDIKSFKDEVDELAVDTEWATEHIKKVKPV